MSRESWTSLAERVEKAGGPDIMIDRDVMILAGARPAWAKTDERPLVLHCRDLSGVPYPTLGKGGPSIATIQYTASVDACLALISETLPGWGWSLCAGPGGAAAVITQLAAEFRQHRSETSTPTLALLAVYCRARAASVIEIAGSGEPT